jgi:hypothetical protein
VEANAALTLERHEAVIEGTCANHGGVELDELGVSKVRIGFRIERAIVAQHPQHVGAIGAVASGRARDGLGLARFLRQRSGHRQKPRSSCSASPHAAGVVRRLARGGT